jgi:hypothetical protein
MAARHKVALSLSALDSTHESVWYWDSENPCCRYPQACKCLCSSSHLGRSYGTSHGSQSGLHLCSVTCPRVDHLALCLASTVRGFGASTSPISTAKAGWSNQAWQERSPATLPLLCLSPQQQLQACRTLCGILSLGLHSFAGLQVAFEGVRWQQHKGQRGKRLDRCEWCPDWTKSRGARQYHRRRQASMRPMPEDNNERDLLSHATLLLGC